jgi:hypothetical protein
MPRKVRFWLLLQPYRIAQEECSKKRFHSFTAAGFVLARGLQLQIPDRAGYGGCAECRNIKRWWTADCQPAAGTSVAVRL